VLKFQGAVLCAAFEASKVGGSSAVAYHRSLSGGTQPLEIPRREGASHVGEALFPDAPGASTPTARQGSGWRRVRPKEGKIDGMDYYEFCELIRSSSL
jgi:hypothetical protein